MELSVKSIAFIINLCLNSTYTSVQKQECVSVFGSCMANFDNKDSAVKTCEAKWKKVGNEIK